MQSELDSLESQKVFSKVSLPPGRRAIGTKWVFALKRNINGEVERFKARLVVQGFRQVPGVDYFESYSPTTKMETVKILLTIVACEDLHCEILDAKNAYTQADLLETIHFEDGDGVWRLHKALYGLVQAGAAWYGTLDAYLDKIEVGHVDSDQYLYVGWRERQRLLVVVYVDDMVVAGGREVVKWFITEMKKRFALDERGELGNGKGLLLGMEVKRDRKARTITLSQRVAVGKLLETYGMEEAKEVSTPLQPGLTLLPHDSDPTTSPYRKLVGSLGYLVHTRPEISYAVGLLGRFSANPSDEHFNVAKHVLRYLRGTQTYGLVLGSSSSSSPIVEAWADSDYAGDKADRKSTSGYLVKVFGSTVVCASKKQKAVSTSTLHAETVALASLARSVVWVRELHQSLGYTTPATTVHSDNQGTISTIFSGARTEATKHIAVNHLYTREQVQSEVILLEYIPSSENTADVLTKAISRESIVKHRESLGVREG
ncbi:hypothetical protein JCM11641_001680 [Rhodosporidiobolus odoratus]